VLIVPIAKEAIFRHRNLQSTAPGLFFHASQVLMMRHAELTEWPTPLLRPRAM
jgi:hypothetical protein